MERKVKDPWRRRRIQQTEVLLKKLIHPVNRSNTSNNKLTADVPAQHELIPIVKENMQRIMDGENVLEILPDLDYVASIVISGIISTKDLMTCKLIFDSLAQGINPELQAELTKEVKRFFETVYPISDNLYEILYDVIARTGSYMLGIIPESSVDRIINEGGQIGTENANNANILRDAMSLRGILGDPNATAKENNEVGIENFIGQYMAPRAAGTGFKVTMAGKVSNFEKPKKVGEGDEQTIEYEKDDIDFGFTLTDNPDVLKLPRLSAAAARQRVSSTYNDLMKSSVNYGLENRDGQGHIDAFVGLEREETLFTYFDKTAYKHRNYATKAVEEIRPTETAGRRSVGHPMYQHFPSDSTILCHTPGTFGQPAGAFIVMDEQGYAVTRHSRMYNASATAWIMGNPSSQMINDVALGMGIGKDEDPNREWTMSKLIDSYAQLVEAKLIQALKTGAYGGSLNIVRPTQVYQIMMARALAKKRTQILFIPAEQMVYFALDWTPDGLGRSRLDKTRMISTVRSAIALATMQSTVLNATRNIKLTVTLAPEDRDGEKTIQEAVFRASQQFMSRIPYSGTPDDVMAYIANAGIDVDVEGNDFYPSTKVDVTENTPDYKVPDQATDEGLARKQARALGADPDLVMNPESIEFASQITTKNVFNTKRIIQDQQRLSPMLSHWVKVHIYSDPIIIDRLSAIVRKHLERFATAREELEKAKLDTDNRDAEPTETITQSDDEMFGMEMFTEGTITMDDLKREATQDPTAVNAITKNRHEAIVKKVLSRYVAHISVTLPAPDTGKLNSQMELFDKRMEHVRKQLDETIVDGIYDGTVYEGSEDKMRKILASIAAYQWLVENDVDPDLMELMSPDPDKLDEVVNRISSIHGDRAYGILRVIKGLERKLQSNAKKLDVEANEEMEPGQILGNDGGGSSEFGDDNSGDGTGDEFGFDLEGDGEGDDFDLGGEGDDAGEGDLGDGDGDAAASTDDNTDGDGSEGDDAGTDLGADTEQSSSVSLDELDDEENQQP